MHPQLQAGDITSENSPLYLKNIVEQEEAAEAHLPQPDRILNVEPVFPSLPPISPTPTTPICTPPSSPSLPSPPQFEVFDYPAPPSLPPTPPQLSLEEEVLDDSFVLPPPTPSPTVCSDEDLDATFPMPPPEVMCTEVLSKPIPVQQIANLLSATPASPGNKCGKCNRIGRPGALWIQCCGCERWFHRACSGLTYSRFKQMTEEAVWNCQHC